jgi:hypothetical protein
MGAAFSLSVPQFYFVAKGKTQLPTGYKRPTRTSASTFDEWHDWAMTHKDRLKPGDEHIYVSQDNVPFYASDLAPLTPKVRAAPLLDNPVSDCTVISAGLVLISNCALQLAGRCVRVCRRVLGVNVSFRSTR